MELVTALRRLVKRRLFVALGALAAVVVGLGVSAGTGPFGEEEEASALAVGDVQIDTPRPLAADLRASEKTIVDQAVLLAERLAGHDEQAIIARLAGVPLRSLSVRGTRDEVTPPFSALAQQATDAAAEAPRGPYRVDFAPADDAPVLSYWVSAPDAPAASRLASAVPAALELIAAKADPGTGSQRLLVKPLAPPRVTAILSGGSRPDHRVGAIAAVLFFAGWCWCVVLCDGAWRARPNRLGEAGRAFSA